MSEEEPLNPSGKQNKTNIATSTVKTNARGSIDPPKSNDDDENMPFAANRVRKGRTKNASGSNGSKEDKTGYPGYPGSTGSKNRHGYHSSSGSMDYGRGHSLIDRQDAISKDAFSPLCYIQSMIISVALLFCFIGLLIHVNGFPPAQTIVHRETRFGNEALRTRYAVASDNHELSFNLKMEGLKDSPIRAVMMLSLMWMHILEPHSVAPDSSYSGIYFSATLKEQSLVNAEAGRYGDIKVDKKLNNVQIDPNDYTIFDFGYYFAASLLEIENEFSESDYDNTWFDGNKYQAYYQEFFQTFMGGLDGGPNPFEEAYTVKNYKMSNLAAQNQTLMEIAKNFQISPLAAYLAKKYQNASSKAYNSMGYTQPVVEGESKKMTVDLSRFVIEHFSRFKKPSGGNPALTAHRVFLRDNRRNKGNLDEMLWFPKGRTSSLLSAFIVKVIHAVLTSKEMKKDVKEIKMYGMLLVVQRLSYQLLPCSNNWIDFRLNNKGLTDYSDLVIDTFLNGDAEDMNALGEKIGSDLCKRNKPVTRKKFERVSSTMIFKKNTRFNIFASSMGLPTPYQSVYYNNGTKRSDPGSFEVDGGRSEPFSTASTIFFAKNKHYPKVYFAVTSSGSVRNVESTATTILRMLLLGDGPGEAVSSPAVFYDPRDAKFYCESGDEIQDHGVFKKKAEWIWKGLKETFGIQCVKMKSRKEDFEGRDRSAMAFKFGSNGNSVLTATDPRHMDKHNYVAGF